MSKIPEGATHTYTVRGNTTYRRISGNFWEAYTDGDWVRIMAPHQEDYVKLQDYPEWKGKGAPPIGCLVQDWSVMGAPVFIAEVVGVEDGLVAIKRPGSLKVVDQHALRPVKTSDQIAAEKRDAAIKEMQRLVGSCNTFPFAELYDYGYRLQVTK